MFIVSTLELRNKAFSGTKVPTTHQPLQFSTNGMLFWQIPFDILRQESCDEQGLVKKFNFA